MKKFNLILFLALGIIFFSRMAHAQKLLTPYKVFHARLLVDYDTLQTDSEDVVFEEFIGVKQRNLFEKSVTVVFYTIAGIGGGIILYSLTDPPKQSYESLKWAAMGAGVGMTTGILVVTFDLDKPFRKKVKHKR